MAKLKMQKIEIAAAVSECEKIVRLLQRRGVIELTEPEELSYLARSDKTAEITALEKESQIVSSALSILKKYAGKSGGLLSSLEPKAVLSDDDFQQLVENRESLYEVAEKAVEQSKAITDAKVTAIRLKKQIDALRPWSGLDIPMNFRGTAKTSVFIGSFAGETDREALLSKLAQLLPDNDCVDVEIVSSGNMQTCAVVYCAKKDAPEVEQTIRSVGFVPISDPVSKTPKEAMADLESKITDCENQKAQAEETLRALGKKRDELEYLADYLTIEKDKNSALQKLVHSEKIFVLTGYIPEIRAEKIKNDIESKFCAAVELTEPGEDEDVPVLLKNNGFAAPVEPITAMYSLPGKSDIDPTPIMAFFYYLFFGMMLSDAGYGLIIALATGFALIKFKSEPKMRNTIKMYFYCGLSTVFWGAMYGSWFGDMPNIIGSNFFHTEKFASTAIWLDPLNQLMELLVYCFIFGLVHLFVGVGIKAVNLWRHGQKLEALCESIPTAVTIFGFCPIFFGLFTEVPAWLSAVGTPALIIGVILVIATAGRGSKSIVGKIGGGLYGLYNLVSGYLGDVLSYARLLALGLSTGVIAQVVNMLCTLPSSNVLKAIMLIVVGTIGHIANLGINLIGAYVHTNRLQYVEFFSKFYEGGGRAMEPFGINTKKFKFKEEN